ncbi:(4Fe-4S)-binding protein [Candidatus Poribacteria bacterium]|nr:MAG: (4Fe-4S)-binding protein [Candidatus Poribacteria bacterium]
MKTLTVISGKGGTGKTTLVASFASLAKREGVKIVLADCDVDAPDLYILLKPQVKHKELFTEGRVARIDPEKCTGCGECYSHCRFEAILVSDGRYEVDPMECEGCGVCEYVCPSDAVEMRVREGGYWFISDTEYGPMVHARLGIGQGNTGRLVTTVRQAAEEIAAQTGASMVIVDGPPGIGCPVIASVSNTDLVLIVAEPTLSGIHDMERALTLAFHFGVKPLVCINKYDLNLKMTGEIEAFCREAGVEIAGKIPFDQSFVEALAYLKPAVEYVGGNLALKIESIWKRIRREMEV